MSKISYALVAILATTSAAYAAPEFDIAEPYTVEEVDGWDIGISKNHLSCVARAPFLDDTSMWIGGTVHNEEAYVYIAFTNPKWKVENDKLYDTVLNVDNHKKSFKAVGSTVPDAGLSILLDADGFDFLNVIANGEYIEITAGGEQLTKLSLWNAGEAIKTIIKCNKYYIDSYQENSSEPDVDKKHEEEAKDDVVHVLNYTSLGIDVAPPGTQHWVKVDNCIYKQTGTNKTIDFNAIDPANLTFEDVYTTNMNGVLVIKSVVKYEGRILVDHDIVSEAIEMGSAIFAGSLGKALNGMSKRSITAQKDLARIKRGWELIYTDYCVGIKKKF